MYYRGLGIEPTTTALAVSVGTKLVNKLFGGPNPDTPDGWEQAAYGGSAPCSSGSAQRSASEASASIRQLFPTWGKGTRITFDRAEVLRALEAAPQGSAGDPPSAATREGLITALMVPNELRRRPTSLTELANMAVYVAHGRKDCGIGWREEPAVEHLESIVRRYRATRSAPTVSLGLDYEPAPGASGAAYRPDPLVFAGLVGLALLIAKG